MEPLTIIYDERGLVLKRDGQRVAIQGDEELERLAKALRVIRTKRARARRDAINPYLKTK